jgi:hypothetical protein
MQYFVGSNFHILQLNKIAMGQFLKMKNKLVTPKKTLRIINELAILDMPLKYLSNIAPVMAVNITVLIIVKTAFGVSFSAFNSSPSLFRNKVSLMKVVLEKCLTNNGTTKIVSKINIVDNLYWAWALAGTLKDRVIPPLIPNQKTKFQNLSLDSQRLCLGID